jgi:hypothetical protein
MGNHLSREFSECLLMQLKQMKATWVIIENYKKQLQSSRENCRVSLFEAGQQVIQFHRIQQMNIFFYQF